MKTFLQKVAVLIALLLSNSMGIYTQDQPQPVLIDEFGALDCGDIQARQDYFFREISNDSDAAGVAMIFTDVGELQQAVSIESVLIGNLNFRRFDRSRFSVVYVKRSDDFKVQFWKLPKGAVASQHEVFDVSTDTQQSPFILVSYYSDIAACPGDRVGLKRYAETVQAYPNGRGNVVIWARTRKAFERERSHVLKTLVSYGLPAEKLKFFYRKHSEKDMKWEYWVLPKISK